MEGRERTKLSMDSETQGKARACRSSRELGACSKALPGRVGVGRGVGEPDRTKQLRLKPLRGERV